VETLAENSFTKDINFEWDCAGVVQAKEIALFSPSLLKNRQDKTCWSRKAYLILSKQSSVSL